MLVMDKCGVEVLFRGGHLEVSFAFPKREGVTLRLCQVAQIPPKELDGHPKRSCPAH